MATIAVVPGIKPSTPKLVAPRWHTVLFVALFLALTLSGALFQREAHSQPGMLQHPHVVPLYLSLIAMEWGLFLYVWKGGLRRSGTKLCELIGGKWRSPKDVAVDASVALGLCAAWKIVEKGWDHWVGPSHAASIQTFLPRGERSKSCFGLGYRSVPGFAKNWCFAATSKGNSKCSRAADGLP